MRLVNTGLEHIGMYLDHAIFLSDTTIAHVAKLASYFTRLRLYRLNVLPAKSQVGAARVDFLGRSISSDGIRPNCDKVAARK